MMPIEFSSFTDYFKNFKRLIDVAPASQTPTLVDDWYHSIIKGDIPRLKTLGTSFPIPRFFEYAISKCRCGCGDRNSIYSAVRVSKLTRELLEFLLEKAIPAEYRGTVAIDIFYGILIDYKSVSKILPLVTLFKPADILSIPESLDYIMSIFPMYDLKVSRELLDILEGMFPDHKLYNKLCPSAQRHLAIPI
jgi:hypothetical protein